MLLKLLTALIFELIHQFAQSWHLLSITALRPLSDHIP